MALLAAEALDLDHRQALHADLLQRFLDLVELERLDDRFDLLHRASLSGQCEVGRRPAGRNRGRAGRRRGRGGLMRIARNQGGTHNDGQMVNG
jgi:hypothetical protein